MFADFARIAEVLEQLPDKRLAIAFSGGVDSVTLARASEIILGKENVLLLLADSPFAPSQEKNFAIQWAQARQLRCMAVKFDPLQIPEIVRNDVLRCYFCKKAMFSLLKEAALQAGFPVPIFPPGSAAGSRPGPVRSDTAGSFRRFPFPRR